MLRNTRTRHSLDHAILPVTRLLLNMKEHINMYHNIIALIRTPCGLECETEIAAQAYRW